ncbi:MAG TPA: holo-ACP synthase [Aggregatilineales bacterium]|nr:holo-ACP synthase [Anaerolineales bacterium]HRE47597.1 holo-ACP synthase [Aggregatilineales bacterium]
MLRVGVDMIEVRRIAEALARHGDRFLMRCFTLGEQTTCAGAAPRLAARFAAKEAVAKALGTGIGAVRWVEIEVVSDSEGRPSVHLHGDAARLAHALRLTTWEISLTHTDDQALAFVVAMG